jgi:ribosomal protein S17E
VEEIAPEALPKFWQTLTRSSTPLAERFAHVGALLKYLKRCTISIFRERERRIQRRERIRQRLESTNQDIPVQTESEEELLTRIDQEKLLQMVQRWIRTYVTDHQERRILCLSYEYGLTPAEIVKRYPQEFTDTQTVRRVKERILKRARRALKDRYQDCYNGNGRGEKATLGRASVIRSNGQKR